MKDRSPAELILAHQERIGQDNGRQPEQIDALTYLRRIYRNPLEPTSVRIRCAVEALPYENPRLSAVAVGRLSGEDFAARLDRAVEASNRAKLIEGRVIEVEE
jgi:hypothetical protein